MAPIKELGVIMLKSLRLRNFRAFQNQSFEFSRINIFVGANSTGKSSALSAINFVAQSLLRDDGSAGPVSLNNQYEQLGTFRDVIYGNRINTPVTIDLSFDARAGGVHRVAFELKYRQLRRQLEISMFDYQLNNEPFYFYKWRQKDAYEIRLKGKLIESALPDVKKKRPYFDSIIPTDRNLSVLWEEAAKPDSRRFQLLREIDRGLRRARIDMRRQFESYDSLSPFRDQPQRTYLFTGETPSKVGRTGTNGISILVNDASKRGQSRDALLEKISEWLRITGIASAIVLRPLSDRHFEICIKDLDSKMHNICDVGFGCSQVLPVLVGSLNAAINARVNQSSLTVTPIFVVQEPEIHLHPDAQATLGSFFVSLFRRRGQLFIETHSDALVLRIARHVARGELDAKDIAVFFFENGPNGKNVRRLKINERAVFVPPWPGGFFPQRELEALGLARARSRHPTSRRADQLEFNYPESE